MLSFTQPDVRQPRAYVQINGQKLPCVSARVSKGSKRSSDTFSAELSLDITAQLGLDAIWWASQDVIPASILFAVYDGDVGQTMVTGSVDEICIDWIERKVDISGRDKSSTLSETRRSKKYNNQSSADVVNDIASANGLKPVIAGGTAKAGKSWDTDEALLVLGQTDFETLSNLAERDGYRWYVDGGDLHYEPIEQDAKVFELIYRPPTPGSPISANFHDFTTRRNLRAAATVNVKVRSWHPKTKQLNTGTATVPGSSGPALNYEINGAPMLSPAKAKSIALAKANEAIRHEMALHINLPGDLGLDVTQKLSLSGTGTIYDQQYDIDSINFVIGYGRGFEMTIKTKAPKKGRAAS